MAAESKKTPEFSWRSRMFTPRRDNKTTLKVTPLEATPIPHGDISVFRTEVRILKTGLGQTTKKRRTLQLRQIKLELIKGKGEASVTREFLLSDTYSLKIDEKFNAIVIKGKEKNVWLQVGFDETVGKEPTEQQIADNNARALLLINGIRSKYFGYLQPAVSGHLKDNLLDNLFCSKYTGGIAKRDGEEWFYEAKDRLVRSDVGVKGKFCFSWDGAKLVPIDTTTSLLGNGFWDGFQLCFFRASPAVSCALFAEKKEQQEGRSRSKTTAGMSRSESLHTKLNTAPEREALEVSQGIDSLDIPESANHVAEDILRKEKKEKKEKRPASQIKAPPSTKETKGEKAPREVPISFNYIWCPSSMKYLCENDTNEKYCWQWTRHFLKKVNGDGEWIIEGSFPEPVVMFLQILRYLRSVDEFSEPS